MFVINIDLSAYINYICSMNNQIKEFRERGRVSQKLLAEKLEWSNARLCQHEMGRIPTKLDDARRICDILKSFGIKGVRLDTVFPKQEDSAA